MKIPLDLTVAFALLLGSFSYGISLVFFIKALEGLGSSRTGAFFSFAPFIGTIASFIILREWIEWVMLPATVLMIIGVWLIVTERHSHLHIHRTKTHTHLHNHSDMHQHEHYRKFMKHIFMNTLILNYLTFMFTGQILTIDMNTKQSLRFNER